MSSNSRSPEGGHSPKPPEAWAPLMAFAQNARKPLERFLHIQAASGIILLVAAAIALIWANSSWSHSYHALWQTQLGISVGDFSFSRSLEWVVNDGLMVLFFFVVGMEIRREIHFGELSQWRRAALPVAAALGGMLVPALFYVAVTQTPDLRSGWGVPMATDIAFAVGVLALLGNRVPAAMRVLLLALAVIDDLGAIIVIALFYTPSVNAQGLLYTVLGLALVLLLQRSGVRTKWLYIPPALLAWGGIYATGVHPTIAGVIVGLFTPTTAWIGQRGLREGLRRELKVLDDAGEKGVPEYDLSETVRNVAVYGREARSPAEGLIESLHPWVSFGIMPLFALANAGVSLEGGLPAGAGAMAMLGVGVGLVVGKPIGVLLACWAAVKSGLGILPAGMSTRHLLVLGVTAGIGFTMSIFIAQLAFTDPSLLGAAKLGVLVASVIAAVLSLVLGRLLLKPVAATGVAQTADEAESSTTL